MSDGIIAENITQSDALAMSPFSRKEWQEIRTPLLGIRTPSTERIIRLNFFGGARALVNVGYRPESLISILMAGPRY